MLSSRTPTVRTPLWYILFYFVPVVSTQHKIILKNHIVLLRLHTKILREVGEKEHWNI